MGECENGLMVHCPFQYNEKASNYCQQMVDWKQVKGDGSACSVELICNVLPL